MKLLPLFCCAALAALILPGPAAADRCDVKARRDGRIDATGAKLIEVIGRAGSLTVTGRDGATEVRATGTACASDDALLAETLLVTRREGDSVVVEAQMPDLSGAGWMGDTARLDLTVEVPSHVALSVIDSSGDLEIDHVASLDVQDSSGGMVITEVAGDLHVQDSSGSVRIAGVGGHIQLTDSSGDIRIDDVGGDVVIESDSSGGININEARSVLIKQDSSGDIDVSNIHEDVIVRADSSGSISVSAIGGDFTVGRDGSGTISYRDVAGKVDVPKRN